MLNYVLRNDVNRPSILKIKQFLDSKWCMFFIVFLAALSNIFSLEIPVLYIYTIIIALTCLFSDDLLPTMPIACCGYMTFSKPNNPLSPEQSSIFNTEVGIINISLIACTIAIFVLFRIIFDLIHHKYTSKKPKLLFGFIALGISYIIGGLFSEEYEFRSSFFGLVQILSLSFCYLLYYFTIDWKKINKDFFATLFASLSVLLSVEILGMLIQSDFFISLETFDRDQLYTGWGINNNVGAMGCICFPSFFYFACTKKNGWIYSLLGTISYLFITLTQSRASILCGLILYVFCTVTTLIKTKDKRRNYIFFTFIFLISICNFIFFNDFIEKIFSKLFELGFSDSGRFMIYRDGFNQFKESWLLGKGFYACDIYQWGVSDPDDFLPARYHNTIIQLLASGGVVMFIAYSYHRIETLIMCFKKLTLEKFCIGLCIAGLLSTSLLDCHFFNIGPGFLYSALLLFLEIADERKNTNPTLKV